MIVKIGKRFLKNNVYVFRRSKKRHDYMLCLLVDGQHACFVPIHGKGEECEENCYTLEMDKPEVLINDVAVNSEVVIERYGYAAEGQYWSHESV